jgi:hypothetical protein
MKTSVDTELVTEKNNVAHLACQLWDKAGRPAGRDLEFWLEAEKELLNAPQDQHNAPEPKAGTESVAVRPTEPAASSADAAATDRTEAALPPPRKKAARRFLDEVAGISRKRSRSKK